MVKEPISLSAVVKEVFDVAAPQAKLKNILERRKTAAEKAKKAKPDGRK